MLIRILAMLLLSMACLAEGQELFQLSNSGQQQRYLDVDSVKRLEDEQVDFAIRQISSRGYRPATASERVAISATEYVVDCRRNRWKSVKIRYITDEGKDVGHADVPAPDRTWNDIAPGGELETVRNKLCATG